MKKLIIITFLILFFNSLNAYFHFFEENPASIADRNFKEFYLPLLTNQFNVNNDLLQFDDLMIFQSGRIMKESEKRKLTKDDLNIEINGKMEILSWGLKNWNLSFSYIFFAEAELLEKEYTKLVLYGNDNDSYKTTNGEGSEFASFYKSSLTYAHGKPFDLNFIHKKDYQNKLLDKIITTLAEMPIYWGVRLNFYYSHLYGYIPVSEQEFGSSYLETYGQYKFQYYYTDDKSNGKLSLGLGLGIKSKLPSGWFYLHLDDLFSSLSYENIALEYEEGVYQDSLTYFDDAYEALNETFSEKSRIKNKSFKLAPTFNLGYVHNYSNRLCFIFRYKSSPYEFQDGVSIGIDYSVFNRIPIQFVVGKEKNFYFEIKTGLKLKNFEYMVATTFYHGMFRYARGIGFKIGLKYIY